MSNRYKVVGPRPVEGAAPGSELEHEFDAGTEQGHLDAKRLEIIPRAYRVCGPRRVHDTEPNGIFEAALTVGNEASLVEAGHIERVKESAKKKAEVKGKAESQN